jgi:arylformamidase
MKIYDISMEIHPGMPVYKNKEDKRPVLTVRNNLSGGGTYESRIQMDLHTGTHVDAPLHMLPGGATVDKIDPGKMVTKCKVFDFTGLPDRITRDDLARKDIQQGDFILLKTRNSYANHFDFAFVYLDGGGAAYLQNLEVAGVGIDALGIERNQPGHETHKLLFQAGIVILEGLMLGEVEEGEYLLVAAPLKIKGAESAPARALLLKED